LGTKAAKILGLRIRALDVDVAVVADNTGLTGHGFRTAVEEDRARGLHPFVLSESFFARITWTLAKLSDDSVATVGTTSSGAIDQVADVGAASKS
jgi:aromatic-L-amino-acid decarboxylase